MWNFFVLKHEHSPDKYVQMCLKPFIPPPIPNTSNNGSLEKRNSAHKQAHNNKRGFISMSVFTSLSFICHFLTVCVQLKISTASLRTGPPLASQWPTVGSVSASRASFWIVRRSVVFQPSTSHQSEQQLSAIWCLMSVAVLAQGKAFRLVLFCHSKGVGVPFLSRGWYCQCWESQS